MILLFIWVEFWRMLLIELVSSMLLYAWPPYIASNVPSHVLTQQPAQLGRPVLGGILK